MNRYTVKQLAKLSGVTVRTLHYYDEIDLLNPAEIGDNGYRYYFRSELLRLQQILFYRDLDMPLKQIKALLDAPDFDQIGTLKTHRIRLLEEIERHHHLVQTIDQTIIELDGETTMNTNPFKGFSPEKQSAFEEEIIERGGEHAKQHVETARKNVGKMSPQQAEKIQAEGEAINVELVACIKAGDSTDADNVQALIARQHAWVANFWTPGKQAYIGLGQSYVDDERFRAFYDKHDLRLVDFLCEAMAIYAEKNLD